MPEPNGFKHDTGGRSDPKTIPVETFVKYMVANTAMTRLKWLRDIIDNRRDLDDECHWPKEITPEHLQRLYERHPVAARVVEVMPKESWQLTPEVYEDEDVRVETPFESGLKNLSQSLRGEESFYEDECNGIFWEYLRRADIQSGIGRYGVLLLGLNDGQELSSPARMEPNQKLSDGTTPDSQTNQSNRRLLYMRVFPESLAHVTAYEQDRRSPRFGQPLKYQIRMHDPSNTSSFGAAPPSSTYDVHWTRVVHIADNLGSSEVLGDSRIIPVINNLLDLQKLYGASAEGYWRGAFVGLSLETNPQLGGEVAIADEDLRDMMEDYANGMQRYIALSGMIAKSLAPQVVEPVTQIAVQIEAICIKLGIPVRVFKGSERGELASYQDDAAWNDRLRERQNHYITPRVIVPTVDRLIMLGILPRPKKYKVWWPDLESQGTAEKADIAMKRTQAMAQYVQGGAATLMGAVDYLSKVLGLPEAEAAKVVDNAVKDIKERKKLMETLDPTPEPVEKKDPEGKAPRKKPNPEKPAVKE